MRWAAFRGRLKVVKFLVLPDLGSVAIAQGANIHANNDGALEKVASGNNNDVWQVLSAFIQEEKLLVAVSEFMQELSSVEAAPKNKRPPIAKTKRSKI